MSTIIENIERSQMRDGIPHFQAGDSVRVHFQVIEGNRRRTQVFEGIVIKRQGSGNRETFTVRKQSFGVGVERTFPLHSPKIEDLEVAARGDVRRAKLYYLRGRVGKAARIAERRWGSDEAASMSAKKAQAEVVAPEEDEGAVATEELAPEPEAAETEPEAAETEPEAADVAEPESASTEPDSGDAESDRRAD